MFQITFWSGEKPSQPKRSMRVTHHGPTEATNCPTQPNVLLHGYILSFAKKKCYSHKLPMFAVNFRLEPSSSRSGSGPCTIHLTCVHSNDPPRLSRKKQLGIIILKLISHFNGNGEIIQTLFFSSCPQAES